ncbi:MAG: GNAT family N-acetyltransferase [Omnitrophica WOR_2 bacterium]
MVQFIPMTETEFQAYLAEAIQRYAEEHVRAGNWHPVEALEKSRREHEQLLPEGLASKNNYLYSIIDENSGSRLGIIWFVVDLDRPRRSAFIYDFQIFDEFRRKGYGSQALEALEEKLRASGIEAISLHVFGHNPIAQALYRKMGYEVTGIHMTRQIKP